MKRDTFWGTEEIVSRKEDLYQVKILHAYLPLSLQVHPRIEEGGKFEVQIALLGTKTYNSTIRSTDFLNLKEVNEKTLSSLSRITELIPRTSKGILEIDPGVVHGLVQGKVLEISQHSDITYRLGRAFGRELHIEEALKVIRRGSYKREQPEYFSRYSYDLQHLASESLKYSEFLRVDYEGSSERLSSEEIRKIAQNNDERFDYIFIPTKKA